MGISDTDEQDPRMLAALPRPADGHPALGAVIYLVIVVTLVGCTVVAARRDRGRRGPPRR